MAPTPPPSTPSDDWHAVDALIMTYAERVDLGDFAGVAALFEHATYRAEHAGQIESQEGAAAVLATFEGMVRRYDDGTPRTKHVTTNVMVDVEGDTATSRCYYTVFQQTDALALQPIIAGRYHDRFERVDGRWRFADRLIFSDLIGDLSQHLLVDVYGEGTG
jgi:3-phenylpropionate/cinnamic acid dioxygenase small subunit